MKCPVWFEKCLVCQQITNIEAQEGNSSEDARAFQTLSDVPSDFESMAEFIVESRIDPDVSCPPRILRRTPSMLLLLQADVEETDREYYMSRRTSMDELSESGRADSYEFAFSRNYS